MRLLSVKQRQVLYIVHKRSRDYIKYLNLRVLKKVAPFYIFLTGGGGVSKSHLIKTIHISLTKVLMHKGGNPEKPRILLLAPTGVAAININGITVHTDLSINVRSKMYPLNGRQKATLRTRLSVVRFVIIDEISMVSNALSYEVHQRLNEIFQCDHNVPFAGLPVLICGDFYQLPPIRGLSIYTSASSMTEF